LCCRISLNIHSTKARVTAHDHRSHSRMDIPDPVHAIPERIKGAAMISCSTCSRRHSPAWHCPRLGKLSWLTRLMAIVFRCRLYWRHEPSSCDSIFLKISIFSLRCIFRIFLIFLLMNPVWLRKNEHADRMRAFWKDAWRNPYPRTVERVPDL